MNERKMVFGALISILIMCSLCMCIGPATAQLEITYSGVENVSYWEYPMSERQGIIDYRSSGDGYSTATLFIFEDHKEIVREELGINSRNVGGRRCSSRKTFDFPISERNGHHKVTVLLVSENLVISSSGFEYEIHHEESLTRTNDWLECPWSD